MIQAAVVLLLAFLIAGLVTKVLIPLLRKRGVLDIPNERSSHQVPTPRGGGIGIITGCLAGVVCAWFFGLPLPHFSLFLGAASIALLGFIDDRSGGLPSVIRFVVQLMAAGLVVFYSGGLPHFPFPSPLDMPLGVLAIPAAMLWIVGVANLYNFLDGIDGYAGLQGAIAGLAVAFLQPQGSFVAIGCAIAGACCGFMLHNWHPAKIFMGDVASATLGFTFAVLPFQGPLESRSQIVWGMALCLWFFLADGTFTMLRRLLRGEKVWEAHRTHLYQRLVKSGLPHNVVTARVMIGAALLACLTVISIRRDEPKLQWTAFAVAVGAFGLLCGWTASQEKRGAG